MKYGFTRHLLISNTYRNWRKILEKRNFLKYQKSIIIIILTRSETLKIKESETLRRVQGCETRPQIREKFQSRISFQWNDKSRRLCCKYAIRHCFRSCEACFPFLTTFLYRMTLLFSQALRFCGKIYRSHLFSIFPIIIRNSIHI